MRRQPRDDGIFEEVNVSEKQRLAENQCRDCDVHGISDEAVGALDDEVTRGEGGGRRSDSLECKAGEGFEDHGDADGHEEHTNDAKGGETEQRLTETPAGDPPRDESGDGSGSEDEKSSSSEDGERAPDFVARFLLRCHWSSLGPD